MNIENSFMANHIFTKKDNTHYEGGMNMDNTILTGGFPLSKISSNKNIKAISHLGIPCGLIHRPSRKNMTGGSGGDIQSIKLKEKDANDYDHDLAEKLFLLINK